MDDNETRYLGPTGGRNARSGRGGGDGRGGWEGAPRGTEQERPRQYFPDPQYQEQAYQEQPYQEPVPAEPEPPQRESKASGAMAVAGVVAAILIAAGLFFFLGRATGASSGSQEPEVITETRVSTVTVTETVQDDSGLHLPELPSEIPTIPDVQVPSWLQDLLNGSPEDAPAEVEQYQQYQEPQA
ncbi:hypothetical protein V5S96_09145 [Corynebacterium mastitidis]|uniref:Uncharacterized protein n=1 Tax=Corynebacterium mastitidis TaxID=161890 RepID=A0ABU8NZS3_9CORY